MDTTQQTEKAEWTYKQGFGWVQRDVEAARILEGDVEAWLRVRSSDVEEWAA